jgi:hypothetical protein
MLRRSVRRVAGRGFSDRALHPMHDGVSEGMLALA